MTGANFVKRISKILKLISLVIPRPEDFPEGF